jgi:hypothetical protein
LVLGWILFHGLQDVAPATQGLAGQMWFAAIVLFIGMNFPVLLLSLLIAWSLPARFSDAYWPIAGCTFWLAWYGLVRAWEWWVRVPVRRVQ